MLAALNSGMSQLVPRIADKARYLGIKLTEASYTTLIQAYAESGGSEQAVQCLDHMVSTRDLIELSTISTYHITF